MAAYVPVTQSGRIVWCSGQLPVRNGEKPYVGRLGAEVSAQDGYAAAQLCALNLLAQLKKHLGDLDRITRILDARIYVASTQLGRVRLGQAARLKVDSYPDRIFRGKVTEIAQDAEFTPRQTLTQEERANLVFFVKVKIENPQGILKPGLPVDVELP